MGTELIDLMRRRRTVRKYLSKPVNEESLNRILEAATLPPSGLDVLPYAFIVITDEKAKQRIRTGAETAESEFHSSVKTEVKKFVDFKKITWEKPFLTEAPVLLVIAGDTTNPYWLESVWIAISYIILAIENDGLASLTYTPSDTGFLRELLDIPPHFSPEAILPIGYSAENLPPKDTRPEGKIFYERYKS